VARCPSGSRTSRSGNGQNGQIPSPARFVGRRAASSPAPLPAPEPPRPGDAWSPRRIDGPASASTPRRLARWRTRRIGPSLDRRGAGGTKGVEDGGDKADERDLERQLWAATETLREAVRRLLQAGDIHPTMIVLAVAEMAGEMGADAAMVNGEDVESLLGDLAEVMRAAGLEHHVTLQGEGLPVTGNA
jgi:hypothetical protein